MLFVVLVIFSCKEAGSNGKGSIQVIIPDDEAAEGLDAVFEGEGIGEDTVIEDEVNDD